MRQTKCSLIPPRSEGNRPLGLSSNRASALCLHFIAAFVFYSSSDSTLAQTSRRRRWAAAAASAAWTRPTLCGTVPASQSTACAARRGFCFVTVFVFCFPQLLCSFVLRDAGFSGCSWVRWAAAWAACPAWAAAGGAVGAVPLAAFPSILDDLVC